MRLAVFSHKVCWRSTASPSSYATDGGFPFQMFALSELFETTTLVVPCESDGDREGEIVLAGHRLSVARLSAPVGRGIWRKLLLPFWLMRNLPVLVREILSADAVHTPIPGDVGTLGMLLAFFCRKPLFVRHCGNWLVQRTFAEQFWRWFIERFGGKSIVTLVTGGSETPPSQRNAAVRWIFSTSLTEDELRAYGAPRQVRAGEGIKLIIACRQEKGKGTRTVLESLPLILQDFPGTTLDVVGDGSGLTELKEVAASLGIADRVIFQGKVDHGTVIRLLQQSHVFCYPTASEGFPKVVLEALACGLPVITTRVSVLPQLVGTGCGLLLDEVSAEALANAVRDCLSDTERYRQMSVRAVQTAAQYSLERWRDTIGERLSAAWGPLKADV